MPPHSSVSKVPRATSYSKEQHYEKARAGTCCCCVTYRRFGSQLRRWRPVAANHDLSDHRMPIGQCRKTRGKPDVVTVESCSQLACNSLRGEL